MIYVGYKTSCVQSITRRYCRSVDKTIFLYTFHNKLLEGWGNDYTAAVAYIKRVTFSSVSVIASSLTCMHTAQSWKAICIRHYFVHNVIKTKIKLSWVKLCTNIEIFGWFRRINTKHIMVYFTKTLLSKCR